MLSFYDIIMETAIRTAIAGATSIGLCQRYWM